MTGGVIGALVLFQKQLAKLRGQDMPEDELIDGHWGKQVRLLDMAQQAPDEVMGSGHLQEGSAFWPVWHCQNHLHCMLYLTDRMLEADMLLLLNMTLCEQ